MDCPSDLGLGSPHLLRDTPSAGVCRVEPGLLEGLSATTEAVFRKEALVANTHRSPVSLARALDRVKE